MAIEFKKTALSGSHPAIWRGEVKMLPGGFESGQKLAPGSVLRRGTPLFVDFSEMKAYVCKTAKVLGGGTTTKPRVPKGHLFAVGDIVMKNGKADASPKIKSIDTSNDGYDELTLSAAIAGLEAGDILVLASEYSESESKNAAPLYNPNAVAGADAEFTGKGLPTIDAGYEAVVLYDVTAPYLPDWIENGMCLKSNHSIKLIRQ